MLSLRRIKFGIYDSLLIFSQHLDMQRVDKIRTVAPDESVLDTHFFYGLHRTSEDITAEFIILDTYARTLCRYTPLVGHILGRVVGEYV